MDNLTTLLEGRRGGVRTIPDTITAEEIGTQALQLELRFFRINCRDLADKSALLRTLAQTLSFPNYFGGNWDALEESLSDLEWLPGKGYVILLENTERLAQRAPEELDIAMSIFKDCSAYWAEHGTPFWVLVRGTMNKKGLP